MRVKNQKGFAQILVLLFAVIVITIIVLIGFHIVKTKGTLLPSGNYSKSTAEILTNGDCTGFGSTTIIPPMQLNQVSFVLPYGEVVGGHVTPIDHQYYNGLNPQALRDAYNVVSPVSGRIVNITHRGNKINTPSGTVDMPSTDEYRIVIEHSCSFLTYVDLVTSLDSSIKSQLPSGWTPQNSNWVNIPVKQGQIIGHIGGQTLDFAVWDLSKPLKGFVNFSTDYASAEPWKDFTAPPSSYMAPSVKAQVIAKYIRTAAPVDGKIDYDISGKLIGNWFQVGTGGYHASFNKAQSYWNGHLSIAPDNIDPSVYDASIGNYGAYPGAVISSGDAGSSTDNSAQFMIKSATPDPTVVERSTGLVKYELVPKRYVLPDGSQWNNSSLVTGVSAVSSGSVQATVAAQLTGTNTLKFEVFPGKTSAQVTRFDSRATTYTR